MGVPKKIVFHSNLTEKYKLRNVLRKSYRPEIDPHKYSQLIFDKAAKATQYRKDGLFNWILRWKKKKEFPIQTLPLSQKLALNGSHT